MTKLIETWKDMIRLIYDFDYVCVCYSFCRKEDLTSRRQQRVFTYVYSSVRRSNEHMNTQFHLAPTESQLVSKELGEHDCWKLWKYAKPSCRYMPSYCKVNARYWTVNDMIYHCSLRMNDGISRNRCDCLRLLIEISEFEMKIHIKGKI